MPGAYTYSGTYSAIMKHAVTVIKDLKAGLKQIEHFIKQPQLLWSGRAPRNFKLLPREIVANWFISAIIGHERQSEAITFSTDPVGGDGVIIDKAAQVDVMLTEHVFVPIREPPIPLEDRIAEAVADKMESGETYARGKTLIVFTEGNGGLWHPNRAARRIAGAHAFEGVWVVQLSSADEGGYKYGVACLTLEAGNTQVWTVDINPAFDAWYIERIQ
jgi:hypothetical protein